VRTHQDWTTPSFDLPPVAAAVGPFPQRGFLAALCEVAPEGEPILLDGGDGLIALTLDERAVRMAGMADLTDYHTPLGSRGDELIADFVAGLPPGTHLDLDSLPLEAAEVLAKGLERAGIDVDMRPHTLAAVVELPGDFATYLEAIGKKQRHELRRKRRRYEEAVGEVVHETHLGAGWAFEEFVRLHRLADGGKGEFMDEARLALFARLAALPGWRTDVLRISDREQTAACVFGYADADGYYLYNSSYDPALSEGSPGVTLLGSMIERAIQERRPRFDFLKGDEEYKFRLGSVARPLFRLRGTA
jgi:CelD/BcsL family acetyltransferase involved in cellulose biosynthesis